MLLASPPPETNMKRYSSLGAATPRMYGTGKRATTILADQGDLVHVISDVPYNIRSRHIVTAPSRKPGARKMHQSTLGIKTQPSSDFQTTLQTYHGGPSSKPPPQKPQTFPSQHTSAMRFGQDQEKYWNTMYDHQFMDKGADRPSQLHYPSQLNKVNMNEGGGMKEVLDTGDARSNYRYWSQYNRIHNKLGAMLGPGESRDRDVRTQFNPITGEEKGPAWKDENRRVSGNRILYHGHRAEANKYFVLG